jgi:hypothetical protein
MVRNIVPRARVLGGVDGHRPAAARLRSASRSMRPAMARMVTVLVGLWPLVAMTGLAFALIWAFAMGASP